MNKWLFWIATLPLVLAYLLVSLFALPLAFISKRACVWYFARLERFKHWYDRRIP